MNKAVKLLRNFLFMKDKRVIYLSKMGFYSNMRDADFLIMQYRNVFNRELDLDNPKTFNEKLQWLKVYNRNPLYTKLVDKQAVKDYVSEKIGSEYIIPTIGHWDSVDDINFEELPDQFVLKCTHDSGGLIICTDKKTLNVQAAKKKIQKCLKTNYYLQNREWPYKDVPHRIIAEPYLVDRDLGELRDYKFFCFSGKVRMFKIDFNRFSYHQANYYDRDGHLIPVGEEIYPYDPDKKLAMPKNLDLMIELAEKLSINMPFVRVDFYEVDGNPLFGEMTFFPASGFGKWSDEKYDELFGSWINLNLVEEK